METSYIFLLGGHDLEMLAIKKLVTETVGTAAVLDRGLAWGACASDYRDEIAAIVKRNDIPVLIELEVDLPADIAADAYLVIDHHGERAGSNQPGRDPR